MGKKVDVVVLEEFHNMASLMDRGAVLLKYRISSGIVNFVDSGKKASYLSTEQNLLFPLRCGDVVLVQYLGWGLPLLS